MSHEPECLVTACAKLTDSGVSMHEKYGECYNCPVCICSEIRAAHLRGIRDASITVRYLVDKFEADTVQRGDK